VFRGQRIQESTGSSDRKEAEQYLNSLTSEDLVDVPDPVPLVEAANGFSRQGFSPWRSLRE
ncbi:hypothetical protein Q0P26_14115, partial [Staphylococcus aureus]|nr:hypothetical protein [Staphylococcus aureus]